MKKSLLASILVLLLLLVVAVVGVGAGMAPPVGPFHDPRPSPTPDGQEPEAAPAAPDIPSMPDLVVTEIRVIPSTPRINEEVTIQVTIKNQGSVDVPLDPPQNFYTDLYVDPAVLPIQLFQDGVHAWGCQAYWLPAGASYVLETTYIFDDVKVFALYAQVDTDAQAAEQNENNNVLGPVHVQVTAPSVLIHQTHEDFQMGLASSLDISHPDGVMRRGIFVEPSTEPEVYFPDGQIDDPPTPSNPNNVNQLKPALTGDGTGTLYAVWEDGRNGAVFNRDIYFSRSADEGATWSTPDVRVNDDPIDNTVNQVSPDIEYDASRDLLYVVWQDGRNGDYDIYFRSYDLGADTWGAEHLLSLDPPTSLDADQLNPSLGISPWVSEEIPVSVYVVWQDRRNGNDDVYIIRSDDGGQNWTENIFVTDDPEMTAQNQVAPSVAVGHDSDWDDDVFVAWEDWRVPDNPEVYVARSRDQGLTFGLDVPVDHDPHNTGYRIQPALAVSTTIDMVEIYLPDLGYTITLLCPLTAIHVAWQENAGEEADVYYTYATYNYCEPFACPYPYDFCFQAPQKASGFIIDSDYVLPPDSGETWPTEPSWQGEVAMTRAFKHDWTQCHAWSTITYSMGIFLAWSDASSYDDWRYEIHTRRVASPNGEGGSYELCEDQATGMLNDNAKLHTYRDTGIIIDYEAYEDYKPAATRQSNPYLHADDPPDATFSPRLYLAWDDDRWDDPLALGTVRNRDVFAARWGMNPEGIYISPVFDARNLSTWYVLDWWGATQNYGDLLLQTRFGNNPNAPLDDTAANGWTRWTGNPSSTYLGCVVGADCYYDAPGRHIVDPDGNDWFQCPGPDCPPAYRYIQYKVIVRDFSRITALTRVVIHYKGPTTVYLPLVLRNQ